MLNILKDRVEFSFRPGRLKTGLIRIASVMADGDARVGLEILRRAGRKAEDRGKDQVTVEEIRDAAKEARKFGRSPLLSRLNEHEKIIYKILERKRKVLSGELYKEYCKLAYKPIADRAYRNRMRRMTELGLVKVEGAGRWRSYRIA